MSKQRRNPVSRAEVRFNGSRITTMPVDTVRKDRWGGFEPIRALWAPLLRSLTSDIVREWEAWEPAGRGGGQPPEVTCPYPCNAFLGPWTCLHCSRQFYRVYGASDRYCSDVCADAASRERHAKHNAWLVKARAKERAANRAGRLCAHCSKPLKAQRSTMKFCSPYCRVAANRVARRSERASDHR